MDHTVQTAVEFNFKIECICNSIYVHYKRVGRKNLNAINLITFISHLNYMYICMQIEKEKIFSSILTFYNSIKVFKS